MFFLFDPDILLGTIIILPNNESAVVTAVDHEKKLFRILTDPDSELYEDIPWPEWIVQHDRIGTYAEADKLWGNWFKQVNKRS